MNVSCEKVLPAICDGKTSRLYAVKANGNDDQTALIIEYKDDIMTEDGTRHDVLPGKGALCNQISNILFRYIDKKAAVATSHLYEEGHETPERFGELNEYETVVEKIKPINLTVLVTNIAAGSIVERLHFNDEQVLDTPIVEFCRKDSELENPFISKYQATEAGIIEEEIGDTIEEYAQNINSVLQDFFERCNIALVDMTLEFGRNNDESLTIIGNLSPDNCHLRDTETGRKLDKDVYREDGSLEEVLAVYQEVYDRVKAVWDEYYH